MFIVVYRKGENQMTESSREFRPLNQLEKNLIFAAAPAKKGTNPETGLPYQSRIQPEDPRHVHHNHLRVSYETMQGGFTVCVLVLKLWEGGKEDMTTYIWRGASRRSYKDRRKPVRGEMLAFSRTIFYSRPLAA